MRPSLSWGVSYKDVMNVWLLGCVLYNILVRDMLSNVGAVKREPSSKLHPKVLVAADAIDLIWLLLSVHPADRPTARRPNRTGGCSVRMTM